MKKLLVRWVCCFALAIFLWGRVLPGVSDRPSGTHAEIAYVFDGDTVEVNLADGRALRVRLLGINAPEVAHKQDGSAAEPYGDAARAALRKLLPVGKEVLLEYDADRTDKYGRELCYIWLDGLSVNLYLIEQGCARSLFFRENTRRKAEFERAEAAARAAQVGLWATPGG
ncbi:MAG: thermonuclease family protein [Clostridia bacterium]